MKLKCNSFFKDLQPEELIQCLPCAGQSLSAFNDSLALPYVRKDHDLIDHLALIVMKDVSDHPKKPANEGMSTILKTTTLAQLVMCEIKRFGFSFKNFSEALEVNAATFSLSLREPRHWFDANMAQVCTTMYVLPIDLKFLKIELILI